MTGVTSEFPYTLFSEKFWFVVVTLLFKLRISFFFLNNRLLVFCNDPPFNIAGREENVYIR